jgi:hypothetical protein
MKQLDWKSFAIGVLLTTTVILGTGTTKRTSWTEDWSRDMKWDVIITKTKKEREAVPPGYQPFQAWDGGLHNEVAYRKRTF